MDDQLHVANTAQKPHACAFAMAPWNHGNKTDYIVFTTNSLKLRCRWYLFKYSVHGIRTSEMECPEFRLVMGCPHALYCFTDYNILPATWQDHVDQQAKERGHLTFCILQCRTTPEGETPKAICEEVVQNPEAIYEQVSETR